MRYYLILFPLFVVAKLHAQSDTIPVTMGKTTSLQFAQAIKHIDRGSADFLVQQPNGIATVVQIKAATAGFPTSNLTVITADEHLHNFIIVYLDNPASYQYHITDPDDIPSRIMIQPSLLWHNQDWNANMRLHLAGIYIKDDILYYKLILQNYSNIGFGIDQLQFYTRDRKKGKRTANQELEQIPLHVFGNTGEVPPLGKLSLVIAFHKFTVGKNKRFIIRVLEKDGGRDLQLTIRDRTIIRAKLI